MTTTDISSGEGYNPGPTLDNGEFVFNQEARLRDVELTQAIQAGYTPAEPTEDNPQPRIIDGTLSEDAQAALAKLWGEYRPLAIKTANKRRQTVSKLPALEVDDLIDECYFGLYHASITWHQDRKHGFIRHAEVLMQNYTQRYIDRTSTTIRLPENERQDVRRYRRKKWELYQATEHYPRREFVAKTLGTTATELSDIEVSEAMTMQMGTIDGGYTSDDRDVKSTFDVGEGKWQRIDPAARTYKTIEDEATNDAVVELVHEIIGFREGDLTEEEITDLDRTIIWGRFFAPDRLSLNEMSKTLNITRDGVRKREAKILHALRTSNARDQLLSILIG